MSRLRESSLIDGITGHRSSQQEFCNRIGAKRTLTEPRLQKADDEYAP
jgi:hypothetical protein